MTKYQAHATLGRRCLFWVEVSGNIAHHGAGEGMAPGFHFQQGDHESEAIYILAAAEEEAERRSQNGNATLLDHSCSLGCSFQGAITSQKMPFHIQILTISN